MNSSLGNELPENAQRNLSLAMATILAIVSASYALEATADTTEETITVHGVRPPEPRTPDYTFLNWSISRTQNSMSRGYNDTTGHQDLTYNYPNFDHLRDITPGKCDVLKGNPINISNGTKVESETDFTSQTTEMPLFFQRIYNHRKPMGGILGEGWTTNLELGFGWDGADNISLYRPDGRTINFTKQPGSAYWTENAPNSIAYISRNTSNSTFTHFTSDGLTETYGAVRPPITVHLGYYITEIKNKAGVGWHFSYGANNYNSIVPQPVSVTHTSGKKITLNWQNSRLTSVVDPAGNIYQYSYTTAQDPSQLFFKLDTVIMPDGMVQQYHYNPPMMEGGLTGKSINGVKYSTFTYQRYEWMVYDETGHGGPADVYHAASSEHTGGVERSSFEYTLKTDDYSGRIIAVKETNPLGKQTTYNFTDGKLVSTTGHPSATCSFSYKEQSYDTNGFPDIVSDFNGNITNFDYAPDGKLLREVTAAGTPQQQSVDYVWNERRLPSKITKSGQLETSYIYDDKDKPISISAKNLSSAGVPGQIRTTTYTYARHPNGMLATVKVDGPAPGDGDAETFIYDSEGNLSSLRNSLNHTITYANYNGLGQPGRIVGANGEIVDYGYDSRGRLTLIRNYFDGTNAADTKFKYNLNGLLESKTTADGVETKYVYDDARRLLREYRRMADGTYIQKRYTYNNASLVTSIVTERTTTIIP